MGTLVALYKREGLFVDVQLAKYYSCTYVSVLNIAVGSVRERPLFCALFTIQTMFEFILTHPPTIQFEHRGQINVHTLKDTLVFNILVHVS